MSEKVLKLFEDTAAAGARLCALEFSAVRDLKRARVCSEDEERLYHNAERDRQAALAAHERDESLSLDNLLKKIQAIADESSNESILAGAADIRKQHNILKDAEYELDTRKNKCVGPARSSTAEEMLDRELQEDRTEVDERRAEAQQAEGELQRVQQKIATLSEQQKEHSNMATLAQSYAAAQKRIEDAKTAAAQIREEITAVASEKQELEAQLRAGSAGATSSTRASLSPSSELQHEAERAESALEAELQSLRSSLEARDASLAQQHTESLQPILDEIARANAARDAAATQVAAEAQRRERIRSAVRTYIAAESQRGSVTARLVGMLLDAGGDMPLEELRSRASVEPGNADGAAVLSAVYTLVGCNLATIDRSSTPPKVTLSAKF